MGRMKTGHSEAGIICQISRVNAIHVHRVAGTNTFRMTIRAAAKSARLEAWLWMLAPDLQSFQDCRG